VTKSHVVFMIHRITVLEISEACNLTKNIAFQLGPGQLTCHEQRSNQRAK